MKKIITVALLAASLIIASDATDAKKEFEAKNYEKSFAMFMQIANDGMVAKYNLGFMYETGKGVDQNITKAIGFYRMSASDGFDKAQFAMGNVYLKGLGGVKPSLENSVAYFKLSAAQGNVDAKKVLEEIKTTLKKNAKKAGVGRAIIRSNVRGDEVFIDGKSYGKTKVSLNLAVGKHSLIIKKKGYTDFKQNIMIEKGKTITIAGKLKKK